VSTFQLIPRGAFSLTASTRFLEGFAPARYRGGTIEPGDVRLRLAFPVEGSWRTAGVVVTQAADGTVHADVHGVELSRLREQLARILSLDVDASGLDAVRAGDAVVDELIRAYPGLRPVCFHSPYEAACWAVIGQRTRITQAAGIKERIAERYGEPRTLEGVRLPVFPAPQRLGDVADQLRLPQAKRERLRGLATAALDGRLDAAWLRSMEPAAALAELQGLAGIGPFSAELVLVRGAGAPDVFPRSERRLHDSMRQLYDRPDADADELAAVADGWAPYRSWVSVLIRTQREDATGEISRTRAGA
jgi:DNA-3-methyladenine glycosylase II